MTVSKDQDGPQSCDFFSLESMSLSTMLEHLKKYQHMHLPFPIFLFFFLSINYVKEIQIIFLLIYHKKISQYFNNFLSINVQLLKKLVQHYFQRSQSYQYRLVYIIQPRRMKKNSQYASSSKFNSQSKFAQRADTRTPQLQKQMQKNASKKNKTPSKNYQQDKVVLMSYKDKSSKSFIQFNEEQLKAQQTSNFKQPEAKCHKCQDFQQNEKQLLKKLKQFQDRQKQLKEKLNQLKNQYEKKVKKYKVKARIQKDQLKLLKWILSQRKEFSQILQQFDKLKNIRPKELDEKIDKQNTFEDIALTERSQFQKPKNQNKNNQKNLNDQTLETKKSHPLPIETIDLEPEKQNFPTERQIQMFNHINVLEQKVMQLSMRNQFLEKMKVKKAQKNVQKLSFNDSVSFTKEFSHNRYHSNLNPSNNYFKDENLREYQYSDDEEFFQPQLTKPNQRFDQMNFSHYRQEYQVESRYISPLRQRLDYINRQQSQRKVGKYEQKANEMIPLVPESRSRYYDSIKERSRLLGI